MYSLEFLKSLGLDPKIWNAWSPFKEIIDKTDNVKIEAETDNLFTEQEKAALPIRCLNCVHSKLSDIGDYCEAAEILIDDLEKEISCDSFQRRQCKNCGFYEEGFCYAQDGKITKNPEDECMYDALEFL
jgi:hypothetical protein